MYQISEFSRITGLTVKALRYYDGQGLLTPSARGENGYRYYSDGDYEKARLIALLRQLDFSIAELRDVLQSDNYQADLPFYLQEKKAAIGQRIQRERQIMRRIDGYMQPGAGEQPSQAYQVREKVFPAVTVASVRYLGAYSDAGKHVGRLMKALRSKPLGPNFQLYYDPDYREIADIELCVPVEEGCTASGVSLRRLPAFRALCTTNMGPYHTLGGAYKAVLDEVARRGLRAVAPSREIYIKGPGMVLRGNSSRYITEIAVPFKGGQKIE